MDKKFVSILICPKTMKPLKIHSSQKFLVCADNKIAYPIFDGIPYLIEEKSVPFSSLSDISLPTSDEKKYSKEKK